MFQPTVKRHVCTEPAPPQRSAAASWGTVEKLATKVKFSFSATYFSSEDHILSFQVKKRISPNFLNYLREFYPSIIRFLDTRF